MIRAPSCLSVSSSSTSRSMRWHQSQCCPAKQWFRDPVMLSSHLTASAVPTSMLRQCLIQRKCPQTHVESGFGSRNQDLHVFKDRGRHPWLAAGSLLFTPSAPLLAAVNNQPPDKVQTYFHEHGPKAVRPNKAIIFALYNQNGDLKRLYCSLLNLSGAEMKYESLSSFSR